MNIDVKKEENKDDVHTYPLNLDCTMLNYFEPQKSYKDFKFLFKFKNKKKSKKMEIKKDKLNLDNEGKNDTKIIEKKENENDLNFDVKNEEIEKQEKKEIIIEEKKDLETVKKDVICKDEKESVTGIIEEKKVLEEETKNEEKEKNDTENANNEKEEEKESVTGIIEEKKDLKEEETKKEEIEKNEKKDLENATDEKMKQQKNDDSPSEKQKKINKSKEKKKEEEKSTKIKSIENEKNDEKKDKIKYPFKNFIVYNFINKKFQNVDVKDVKGFNKIEFLSPISVANIGIGKTRVKAFVSGRKGVRRGRGRGKILKGKILRRGDDVNKFIHPVDQFRLSFNNYFLYEFMNYNEGSNSYNFDEKCDEESNVKVKKKAFHLFCELSFTEIKRIYQTSMRLYFSNNLEIRKKIMKSQNRKIYYHKDVSEILFNRENQKKLFFNFSSILFPIIEDDDVEGENKKLLNLNFLMNNSSDRSTQINSLNCEKIENDIKKYKDEKIREKFIEKVNLQKQKLVTTIEKYQNKILEIYEESLKNFNQKIKIFKSVNQKKKYETIRLKDKKFHTCFTTLLLYCSDSFVIIFKFLKTYDVLNSFLTCCSFFYKFIYEKIYLKLEFNSTKSFRKCNLKESNILCLKFSSIIINDKVPTRKKSSFKDININLDDFVSKKLLNIVDNNFAYLKEIKLKFFTLTYLFENYSVQLLRTIFVKCKKLKNFSIGTNIFNSSNLIKKVKINASIKLSYLKFDISNFSIFRNDEYKNSFLDDDINYDRTDNDMMYKKNTFQHLFEFIRERGNDLKSLKIYSRNNTKFKNDYKDSINGIKAFTELYDFLFKYENHSKYLKNIKDLTIPLIESIPFPYYTYSSFFLKLEKLKIYRLGFDLKKTARTNYSMFRNQNDDYLSPKNKRKDDNNNENDDKEIKDELEMKNLKNNFQTFIQEISKGTFSNLKSICILFYNPFPNELNIVCRSKVFKVILSLEQNTNLFIRRIVAQLDLKSYNIENINFILSSSSILKASTKHIFINKFIIETKIKKLKISNTKMSTVIRNNSISSSYLFDRSEKLIFPLIYSKYVQEFSLLFRNNFKRNTPSFILKVITPILKLNKVLKKNEFIHYYESDDIIDDEIEDIESNYRRNKTVVRSNVTYATEKEKNEFLILLNDILINNNESNLESLIIFTDKEFQFKIDQIFLKKKKNNNTTSINNKVELSIIQKQKQEILLLKEQLQKIQLNNNSNVKK